MCKYCEQFNHEACDTFDGAIYHHADYLVGAETQTYCFAAITSKKQLLIGGADEEEGCYYYELKAINYCPMCGRKL